MEGVTNLRVIHDPPASGVWNMAVDEMMLETVAASGQPTLRFYEWEEPTLSLGYFQPLAERESHTASRKCPVVRRSTGGGAIVHDQELTYSIALPIGDRWSTEATALYDTFHGGLVAALEKQGIIATLCPRTIQSLNPEFLCFQRRAKGDVLVGNHKTAGSAQRRRQGAMLQHGSVVLRQSACAPEVLGLSEAGLQVPAMELKALWLHEIERAWAGCCPIAGDWSAAETELAERVKESRFSSISWLARRESAS
jgi:lipoate-protein ligase A